jgi:Flp pilus assembly protein TadG
MHHQKDKRSGQILILFTLFLGFLMGFAAIAFDLAYAMVVRTQLVTALDAATIAAIRAVPQGTAVMQQASQRAFDANLPSGRLMTLNPTLSAPTVTTNTGVISVQFTASVDAPLFFARWFGRDQLVVSALHERSTRPQRHPRSRLLRFGQAGSG